MYITLIIGKIDTKIFTVAILRGEYVSDFYFYFIYHWFISVLYYENSILSIMTYILLCNKKTTNLKS